MTQEELKKCIGKYRELKKDLWWSNRWGVQKIEGYNFGIYYNDFAGHWQFSWNDTENEHRVADIEDIFDNKQDCEEYAEFGNITRTDTLKLPIWEDVKDKGYDEIFFVKDNRFDSGVVQYYFLMAEQTNTIEIMFREIDHIMTITAYDVIFKKPLTRENYNEARRLCVKLFNGEEV